METGCTILPSITSDKPLKLFNKYIARGVIFNECCLSERGPYVFRSGSNQVQRVLCFRTTPSSHSTNSATKICSKGLVAQKPFFDR